MIPVKHTLEQKYETYKDDLTIVQIRFLESYMVTNDQYDCYILQSPSLGLGDHWILASQTSRNQLRRRGIPPAACAADEDLALYPLSHRGNITHVNHQPSLVNLPHLRSRREIRIQ